MALGVRFGNKSSRRREWLKKTHRVNANLDVAIAMRSAYWRPTFWVTDSFFPFRVVAVAPSNRSFPVRFFSFKNLFWLLQFFQTIHYRLLGSCHIRLILLASCRFHSRLLGSCHIRSSLLSTCHIRFILIGSWCFHSRLLGSYRFYYILYTYYYLLFIIYYFGI